MTTSPGQFTGAGFFGRGVDVNTVVRAHNDFLTTEGCQHGGDLPRRTPCAWSSCSGWKGLPPRHRRHRLLGQPVPQRHGRRDQPAQRPSARQVALGRAAELSARFTSAGAQLDQMQAGVVGDLKARVVVINQLADQIAQINGLIAKTKGTGHEPNDLLDQRERLISDLSSHIAVTTLPADDGTVGVFIGGGQRLVLGNAAQQLEVGADAYDPAKATLNLREGAKLRNLDASVLTGGAVTALLAFQNQDLTDARNMLGQLAASFGTHASTPRTAWGWTCPTHPARAAIFNVASPRVMPADTNQRDPSGILSAASAPASSMPSLLQASSYKLTADSSGTYTLTRQSDGYARTVVDGDSIDGFSSASRQPPALPGEAS